MEISSGIEWIQVCLKMWYTFELAMLNRFFFGAINFGATLIDCHGPMDIMDYNEDIVDM